MIQKIRKIYLVLYPIMMLLIAAALILSLIIMGPDIFRIMVEQQGIIEKFGTGRYQIISIADIWMLSDTEIEAEHSLYMTIADDVYAYKKRDSCVYTMSQEGWTKLNLNR